MKPRAASLDQIERWMQSVLMHPGGIAEGMASPQARKHLSVDPQDLQSVIVPSRALSSSERLEIYIDAYHERLLECLREEFPATRNAVGDELFDALAFGYLQSYPSRSYTLAQLGANLPRFLAESRLHAHGAPPGAPAAWTGFVVDLVRFERVVREVYDAPGIEGCPPFDPARLANVAAGQWMRLRLTLAPGLRVERFDHAVNAYWDAFRRRRQAEVSPPDPRYLAIHRRDFVVECHPLSDVEFALLRSLSAGQTLSDAIFQATTAPSSEQLRASFSDWVRLGFFTAAGP